MLSSFWIQLNSSLKHERNPEIFQEILSVKKMLLKILSAKWQSFCSGINVLNLFLCCICQHLYLYLSIFSTNMIDMAYMNDLRANLNNVWKKKISRKCLSKSLSSTLLVLNLVCSEITLSISLLLMPWLLVSPGHQQPWYWLCRTNRSLSSSVEDFNDLEWGILNLFPPFR